MATDLSSLIAGLSATSAAARSRAAEQLAHAGPAAQAAAVPLVRACADAEDAVRQWAAAALEELGPPLASDLAHLTALVHDEQGDVGYWAVTLVGRLGTQAAPSVPTLAGVLASTRDLAVRERAAWALGQIGPPAAAARPQLQQAAAGNAARLARLAQQALRQIGEGPAE
jgi:HEAT repeat protein